MRASQFADPLQLDVEPVAEDRLELQQPAFREMGVVELQRHANRAARAAGEADHPLREFLASVETRIVSPAGLSQIGAADQPHQIGITLLGRGNQHDWIALTPLRVAALGCRLRDRLEGEVQLAADHRLDAFLRGFLANSSAPNRLLVSVMAIAGALSATLCATTFPTVSAPSSNE